MLGFRQYLFCFILSFVFCLLSLDLKGQVEETNEEAVDSTQLSQPDETASHEHVDSSLLFSSSFTPPGSINGKHEVFSDRVTKYQVPTRLQFTLHDLLYSTLSSYQLRGGEPGLPSGYSTAGGSPTDHSILFNGRPLQGAKGENYDLSFYPMEFIESVEFLRGSRVALYGSADALSGVNILQPQFDVEGSYLRLSFVQGGAGTSRAEGVFARNLSRASNVAIGFRRLVSDGIYANQEVDGFNLYGSFYHRSSPSLTFSLTGMLTEFDRGASGGLEATSVSSVINDTLNKGVLRHDLTFSTRWIPGLSAEGDPLNSRKLSKMTRFDGALYFTHADDQWLVGEELTQLPNRSSRQRSDLFGFRGSGITMVGSSELRGVINAEIENAGFSTFHGGGLIAVPLFDGLQLEGGVVLTHRQEVNRVSFVGEVRAQLHDSSVLRGTYRHFIGEENLLPGNSILQLTGEITNWMADVEWELKGGELHGQVHGWLRQGEKTVGMDTYTIAGMSLRGTVPVGIVRLKGTINGMFLPEGDKRFPALATLGEIFVPLTLFNGALDLELGTKIGWQSDFSGVEFDPLSGDWLYPTEVRNTDRQKWGLLDLFASARIGSAYINLSLYNILNAEYRTVSRYPTWGRSLRFGITWGMID